MLDTEPSVETWVVVLRAMNPAKQCRYDDNASQDESDRQGSPAVWSLKYAQSPAFHGVLLSFA